MSLAMWAAVLAAGAMVAVACIRSANRHYHIDHPDLHLESSTTVLVVWGTLVAGVSAENKDYVYRIDDLRRTGAKIKFLSVELLLGPMPKLNLKGINWVIVGGESGPGARPLKREWVIGVRDQCKKEKVPFFFKQWGGVQKKKTGRLLDGRTWDEMPRDMSFAKA